jgi:hypothetical protein
MKKKSQIKNVGWSGWAKQISMEDKKQTYGFSYWSFGVKVGHWDTERSWNKKLKKWVTKDVTCNCVHHPFNS